MNIPRQIFGVNYLTRFINNFTDTEVQNYPKQEFNEIHDLTSFPLEEKTTFSLGISALECSAMLRELMSKKGNALDGFAMSKDEKLVFSGYRVPYKESIPHITNSTCKTVIAIAIMFAFSEDLLQENDYLLSFFPEYESILTSKYMKMIKIKHLLTMTTGSKCNEFFSVVETNWVKAFLQSDCSFQPGSKFVYNSMNTYMLAAVLKKVTGKSVVEYLKGRFFKPLGINDIKWELCPMGIEKGGWGLHITLEGMLKIGIFLAQDGIFHGKQLISPEWIRKMKDILIPQQVDSFSTGYGYQIWHLPNDLYLLSGMYGQNVIFDEKHHLVVATNAHNEKMFPNSPIVRTICKYISNERFYQPQSKWKEIYAYGLFKNEFKSFCNGWKIPESFMNRNFFMYSKKQEKLKQIEKNKIIRIFDFFNNKRIHIDQTSIKLFPYLMQGMYHIQPYHVTDIYVKRDKDFVKLYFLKELTKKEKKEDKAQEYLCIRSGINEYYYQNIQLGIEEKQIAVKAFPSFDEEGNPVVMLDIVFPAEGFSRLIKFFLFEDRIVIESQEYPDMRAIVESILYGEAVIGGNTIDLTNKLPESVQIFLDHKVEPRVNAYFSEK